MCQVDSLGALCASTSVHKVGVYTDVHAPRAQRPQRNVFWPQTHGRTRAENAESAKQMCQVDSFSEPLREYVRAQGGRVHGRTRAEGAETAKECLLAADTRTYTRRERRVRKANVSGGFL